MTEKRFVFDPSISHFTDTKTEKEYCEYNLDKVVDLLNSLSEELYIAENEIARLELINDKLKKEDYSNYINHIKELRDENEQLKKQLNQIKQICNQHRLPATLTAYLPNEDNCKHYHSCHKNHMVNAQSWGGMKIAKEILKLIDGDVE